MYTQLEESILSFIECYGNRKDESEEVKCQETQEKIYEDASKAYKKYKASFCENKYNGEEVPVAWCRITLIYSDAKVKSEFVNDLVDSLGANP